MIPMIHTIYNFRTIPNYKYQSEKTNNLDTYFFMYAHYKMPTVYNLNDTIDWIGDLLFLIEVTESINQNNIISLYDNKKIIFQ